MSSTPATPQDALRTMRLIGISMAAAVTLFAAITFFLHRQDGSAPAGVPLILYVWVAVATSLTAASMILWRGNVVPHLDRPERPWRERAGGIQTGLILTWALVEAAALFGVVVFFLSGIRLAGLLGVAMMWAALVLTWPRPEWLASGSAASD
jgi:hypothetical protein